MTGDTRAIETLLTAHPFTGSLPPGFLEPLTEVAREVRFDAGQFILREGAAVEETYLLHGGIAALELHAPGRGALAIGSVGAGDVLGWSWVLAPYDCHFDARVVEEVRAIALDGTRLREMMEGDHELGFQLTRRFLGIVQQRLERVRMQLLDLYAPLER